MSKELLLLSLYVAIITYLVVTRKRQYLLPAIAALCLGSVWSYALGDTYNYNTATLSLFGANLYALVAWSVGLLAGYMLYVRALHGVKWRENWQKLLLFNLIYIPLLIALETVAYHVFDVVNVGTSMYAGLPVCDCIHAPAWMQLSYILMGTVYITLVWASREISRRSYRFLPKTA